MQHDRTTHGDSLGRASLATTVTGTLVSQRRYLPYGETRPDFAASPFPTDRRCTGQREESVLVGGSLKGVPPAASNPMAAAPSQRDL